MFPIIFDHRNFVRFFCWRRRKLGPIELVVLVDSDFELHWFAVCARESSMVDETT